MGVIRDARGKLTLHRAEAMRRVGTDAEDRLWTALRGGRLEGLKWKCQAPWGPYILDFLCREARLVVEADGSQHADRADYDARRTAALERDGLRVIRFSNREVLTNLGGVCEAILRACDLISSPPAKPRGRGRERAGA